MDLFIVFGKSSGSIYPCTVHGPGEEARAREIADTTPSLAGTPACEYAVAKISLDESAVANLFNVPQLRCKVVA